MRVYLMTTGRRWRERRADFPPEPVKMWEFYQWLNTHGTYDEHGVRAV